MFEDPFCCGGTQHESYHNNEDEVLNPAADVDLEASSLEEQV